jgi:hypothetical protein
MIAYYSGLPLVDMRGLTDAHIARAPVERRGRPGHEKKPTDEYLLSRNVRIIQANWCSKEHLRLTELNLGVNPGRPWRIFVYDRELMRTIETSAPRIRFANFERYLDKYISELSDMPSDRVRKDLKFFKRYYFNHNDDPERLSAIMKYLDNAVQANAPDADESAAESILDAP